MVQQILVIFKLWTRQGRGRRFEARTRPRQKRRGKAEARPRQTFFEARTRQHQMLPRGASRQGICLEDYITASYCPLQFVVLFLHTPMAITPFKGTLAQTITPSCFGPSRQNIKDEGNWGTRLFHTKNISAKWQT